ncbi:MAG TPA: FtsX-like permease family protein [Bryobacteraceae bacterium]|nr:FtsX-like permease family protein [Bryobacteraceae bacterium]
MRYLSLILKNCWRNRRRTVLTVASIGVSMCLLGLMIALYHAFYLSTPAPAQARRLVVRNKISLAVPMPLSYQNQIRQIPGVQEVMIADWFGGVYKDNRDPKNQFARFAIEPDKLFTIYSEFSIPEDQKQAFQHDRTGCVVGRDLVNTFGFKIGDRINITGDIYPGNFEFTVRGIFDSPENSRLMYFNKEYLEQSLPEGRRGQIGMYYVLVDDPAHAASIAGAIDNQFHNSTAQTKSDTEQAFAASFLSMLGNVKMFLMAIAAAVTFTILLVSANTMAMSVRERVREVGVLKTLGFTPQGILAIILGEACSIAVAGGAIGFAISTFLVRGIAKSPFGGFLPPMSVFDPVNASACILAAAAVGLASALVPALSASRMPIVQALRSTD